MVSHVELKKILFGRATVDTILRLDLQFSTRHIMSAKKLQTTALDAQQFFEAIVIGVPLSDRVCSSLSDRTLHYKTFLWRAP
jgi:hypothetical protein